MKYLFASKEVRNAYKKFKKRKELIEKALNFDNNQNDGIILSQTVESTDILTTIIMNNTIPSNNICDNKNKEYGIACLQISKAIELTFSDIKEMLDKEKTYDHMKKLVEPNKTALSEMFNRDLTKELEESFDVEYNPVIDDFAITDPFSMTFFNMKSDEEKRKILYYIPPLISFTGLNDEDKLMLAHLLILSVERFEFYKNNSLF